MIRVALFGPILFSAVARGDDVREQVPALVDRFSSLPFADAIYNRDKTLEVVLDPLLSSLRQQKASDSAAALRRLLDDHSARVRTIGLLLVLRTARPDLLPEVAGLLNDPAQTYRSPRLTQQAFGAAPPPLEPVKVGQYAAAIIDLYASHSASLRKQPWAGRLPQADPAVVAASLKDFAGTHDRLSTAALLVAMDQATGCVSPLQPQYALRIQGVLLDLEQVPMPRRFFVALALDFDRFHDPRYTGDYLLSLARQVPRAARLAAISSELPIDDPDLEPGAGASYFLQHAADLLRDEDIDLLLRLAQDEHHPLRDDCFIAAAMLAPQRVDEILIPALKTFAGEYQQNQRTIIAIALARYGSKPGTDAAIDWVFNEKPQRGAFGFGREMFLDKLAAADAVRFRQIVARLIADSRLPTLGPASTRQLILAVQGYLGRPLVNEDDLRQSYGIDELMERSPFPPLKDWQRQLTETLPQWSR